MKGGLVSDSEMSLLVVVVDVNPGQRILVEESHRLTHCLDAIIAFANSHLMLKTSNRLAVLACNADGRLVNKAESMVLLARDAVKSQRAYKSFSVAS